VDSRLSQRCMKLERMIALRASGPGIYVHPTFETEPPMSPTTHIGQPNGTAVDCHVAIRNIATKILAH
jgi:hypothetical protein